MILFQSYFNVHFNEAKKRLFLLNSIESFKPLSTINARNNYLFFLLFRFSIWSSLSVTNASGTETAASTVSGILVITELFESEARAQRSLLLDTFVFRIQEQKKSISYMKIKYICKPASRPHSADFFPWITNIMFRRLNFKI